MNIQRKAVHRGSGDVVPAPGFTLPSFEQVRKGVRAGTAAIRASEVRMAGRVKFTPRKGAK